MTGGEVHCPYLSPYPYSEPNILLKNLRFSERKSRAPIFHLVRQPYFYTSSQIYMWLFHQPCTTVPCLPNLIANCVVTALELIKDKGI